MPIRIWASLIVAALVCAAAWINASFGRAVDRVGGVRLTYVLDSPPGRVADVLPQTVQVLKRRAAALQHGGDVTVVARGNEVVLDLPVASEGELAVARGALGEIGRLEFKLVDDDADPFERIARNVPEDELPAGLRFQIENAPVGPAHTKPVYYALMVVHGSEGMRGALARLRAWVATLQIPADREIGFEKFYEYDNELDAQVEVGWRTFHLFAKPEITSDMVRDAMARPEVVDGKTERWFVSFELTPQGAAKFEELTARHVKRRFAIVVDNIVQSAPVIQSRISGGYGQIALGAGTLEQQLQDARKLEAALLSGALPVPIALANEQRIERSTAAYLASLLLPGAAAVASLVFFVLLALVPRRRPV